MVELFGLSMLYTFSLISIHSVGKYLNWVFFFLQSWPPAWADKTSRTLCMVCHPSTKGWYYFADNPEDHSISHCKSCHDGNKPCSRREFQNVLGWTVSPLPDRCTNATVIFLPTDSERKKSDPGKTRPWFVHCEFLWEVQGGEGLGVPCGWFLLNSTKLRESP